MTAVARGFVDVVFCSRLLPHRYRCNDGSSDETNQSRPDPTPTQPTRRFNKKSRNVELKSSKHTEDASALQKTADFIQAFMLGFEVQVCVCVCLVCLCLPVCVSAFVCFG